MTPVTYLIDVDNTLLDNDRVTRDLREYLTKEFGADRQQRYWDIFEQLRRELGYADYLGALQRYRLDQPGDSRFLETSLYLLEYPFADRLYPGVLTLLETLKTRGAVAILSDGDAVFQPRKISRSGLWKALNGEVLIYIHKEEMLADVERRYPAQHYVVIDDKVRILDVIKRVWGDRVTTVFVRQGHYAHDTAAAGKYPAADISVESIGELNERALV